MAQPVEALTLIDDGVSHLGKFGVNGQAQNVAVLTLEAQVINLLLVLFA